MKLLSFKIGKALVELFKNKIKNLQKNLFFFLNYTFIQQALEKLIIIISVYLL